MNKLIKTLALSIYFTFSLGVYAHADPANWSKSDNRCPVSSDEFNRDVGTVTGQGGTYYWCYWYESETGIHHISMRPTNTIGGFERTLKTGGETPYYYKNYLTKCAQQYVDNLGFCGST
jgi:hypothetical protein